MTARILLVTGSRALVGSSDEATARAMLAAFVDAYRPSIVVAGDAAGPDEWAIDRAVTTGVGSRIYRLDGTVADAAGRVLRRWGEGSPLDRNTAMVLDVRDQRDKSGAEVRLLALEALYSRTKGTAHTVGRAAYYSIHTTRVTFERSK